jgi:chemotaxis response regulator CheB
MDIPMGATSVVVMGASAGGVSALQKLLEALPPDFGAAVLMALHIAPNHPSHLPGILSRVS